MMHTLYVSSYSVFSIPLAIICPVRQTTGHIRPVKLCSREITREAVHSGTYVVWAGVLAKQHLTLTLPTPM